MKPVVNYINGGLGYEPTQGYFGDAGYDLYVSEEIVIQPMSFADVPTDISMDIPNGMWALIAGRSSTGRKHHLRVELGFLDNGYTGEAFIGVWNLSNKPFVVKRGMRIAQLIFFDLKPVQWNKVDEIRNKERGNNGFGSSGEGL